MYDLIAGSRVDFAPESARYAGVTQEFCSAVTVEVPAKGCVKTVTVTLKNNSASGRAVTLAYYMEPVLGVDRRGARQLSAVFADNALVVRAPFQTDVPGVMGLWCDARNVRCVCDRADFLCGRWEDGANGAPGNPCAALLAEVVLPPRGEVAVVFRMAWAAHETALITLLNMAPEKPKKRCDITIKTPSAALDAYINGFAPHQILACRLWGRTAFYQCGGAYGFRDQLQDICACLLFAPQAAKRQILRAAAVQFVQGDVLHWWHALPGRGGGLRGVRTKYSDDLLWLPFAVCEYVEQMGDGAILEALVPYLDAPELGAEESERYLQPKRTARRGSVYEHCLSAIARAGRLGRHGLPLIGCGDWNDGFNGVGSGGKGESVWLAMFLSVVLERFAPLAQAHGDAKTAEEYRRRAAALKAAVDESCWSERQEARDKKQEARSGEGWYLRAFYDDGGPMGAADSEECRIDALPQSFAVLCGMPDGARVQTALDSALRHLADPELKLVRLFDGPFEHSTREPGYVKAYPAGIRENGGQYTHAGVWLALALLKAGRKEEGWRLLDWLNPVSRCMDADLAARYRLEPYYMAADIYTSPDAAGRGGWSLYTGAASWYCKTVLEELLGLRLRGDRLYVSPHIPAEWPGFEVKLTLCDTLVHIVGRRGDAPAGKLLLDGIPAAFIPLDGGEKEVLLKI